MNAEQFLDALSQAGDDPERIRQLRKIAVALAVTGKLGTAPSNHREGYPTVNADELPADFDNPTDFTRLGAVTRIEKGKTGIKQAVPGGYPMVVTGEDRITCDHFDFDGAAAIVPLVSSAGHGKASLNRLHYAEGRFALGTILAAIFPRDPDQITARFIFEYLSAFKDELLVSRMIGTANVSLSIGKVSEVPIPLVSRAVQRKLDALMALCDRLEAARAEREATRDRLAAASLARLNTPAPETFEADARFAIGTALPALTTRPDQIKQLRQSILNLAVRGKLVLQDPAEKGSATLNINEYPQTNGPFCVPAQWRWSRLLSLGTLRGGGTPSKARDDFWTGAIPWVSPKDMKVDYIADSQLHVSEAAVAGSAANLIASGSILFVVRGMILAHSFPVAVTRVPVTINQDMKALTLKQPEMAEYLLRALKGLKPQMLARVQRSSHVTCRLEGSDYSDFAIPIPPLAEQYRIVAKVDELMDLCDQLEASLTHGENTRSRLLNALLHEALAPAEAALEAA